MHAACCIFGLKNCEKIYEDLSIIWCEELWENYADLSLNLVQIYHNRFVKPDECYIYAQDAYSHYFVAYSHFFSDYFFWLTALNFPS